MDTEVSKEQVISWLQEYDYDHEIKAILISELKRYGKDFYVPEFSDEKSTKEFAEIYEIRCKGINLCEDDEATQFMKKHNGYFYENFEKASKVEGNMYRISQAWTGSFLSFCVNDNGKILFLFIDRLSDLKPRKPKRKFKWSLLIPWLSKS